MCNILKTDFYKYKNGKLYSTCIECFNKKVNCEFCNKEFNKTYLSKHLKRCIKLLEDVYYLNKNQIDDDNEKIILIKLMIIKLMMLMKIIIIKLMIIIIKLIIIVIGH